MSYEERAAGHGRPSQSGLRHKPPSRSNDDPNAMHLQVEVDVMDVTAVRASRRVRSRTAIRVTPPPSPVVPGPTASVSPTLVHVGQPVDMRQAARQMSPEKARSRTSGSRWRFSAVPATEIGQSCINFVRQYGVDTSHVVRQGRRLGTYYIEMGSAVRASKVIYDRAGSSFSELKPGDIILSGTPSGVSGGRAPQGNTANSTVHQVMT